MRSKTAGLRSVAGKVPNLRALKGLGFGAEVRCTSCKTWEAPKLLHLGIRGKCCTPTLSGLLGLGVASFVADHRDGLHFHQQVRVSQASDYQSSAGGPTIGRKQR